MIISLVNQALVTMNVIELLINLPIFDISGDSTFLKITLVGRISGT